jgi:hypothetical protein
MARRPVVEESLRLELVPGKRPGAQHLHGDPDPDRLLEHGLRLIAESGVARLENLAPRVPGLKSRRVTVLVPGVPLGRYASIGPGPDATDRPPDTAPPGIDRDPASGVE